ncbi:hypothetical protein OPV22_028025 [Ensete ventricosum]|uniref:Uncharacterized protein n=1 Tax=Ensete ventricosum TaxID=4639 RepID=A0AAV8PX19_ENSVE|nr:hypothetical protein OPV22_028025 [Ensete ventricosum]
MGCASPLAGSEEEAVAAWGRPAPDTTAAAILVDLIKDASSAVIRIPLLAPSQGFLRFIRTHHVGHGCRWTSEPKCGDCHAIISTGGGSNQEKIWRNFTQKPTAHIQDRALGKDPLRHSHQSCSPRHSSKYISLRTAYASSDSKE